MAHPEQGAQDRKNDNAKSRNASAKVGSKRLETRVSYCASRELKKCNYLLRRQASLCCPERCMLPKEMERQSCESCVVVFGDWEGSSSYPMLM